MTFPKMIMRRTAVLIASAGLLAGAASAHAETCSKTLDSHAKVQSSDIVDTAVNAGSFNTLVAAVQAAGLEDTLRGAGPFTVFAPSDAAFAKLPAGTVETLLRPENKAKLASILTYHVVPGSVKAADLSGKTLDVTTVQGSTVFVDGTHGVDVDNANVVQADIHTSNGVIHVIDTVIMP